MSISNCARGYALALTDPHRVLGRSICIPDSLAQPSFKFSVRSRFEFQIGTAGCGGIAVWPMRMLSATGSVVDTQTCWTIASTTSAYPSTAINFALGDRYASLPPGLVNVTATTSLFSQADFAPPNTRSARLVASGVRVGYTGAVTNQQGTITLIRNPTATSALSSDIDTLQELLTTQDAVRINVRDMLGDNSTGVGYRALVADDYSAVNQPLGTDALNNLTSVSSRLGYVVFVSSATPGTSFTCDIATLFEAYGRSLPLTKSEGDAAGFASVASAVSSTPVSASPDFRSAQILSTAMRNLLGQSGQYVRQYGPQIARGLAEGFINRQSRSQPNRLARALLPPRSFANLELIE